ncbi:Protein of unknown function [Pyronema omphalodes CBS 100304]|uniref:Uncharacterized protein n=1 Tax=Pyronema omphalodes (strain CBS 100304) TaxID=1076935 RepID=U4LK55_PYROM|nr:Protein of unknown function [Pyronema omphalodes CBS 100304]
MGQMLSTIYTAVTGLINFSCSIADIITAPISYVIDLIDKIIYAIVASLIALGLIAIACLAIFYLGLS